MRLKQLHRVGRLDQCFSNFLVLFTPSIYLQISFTLVIQISFTLVV